uniref:Uncharacterized protein n=1 Tax=Anguilla anguilla TaxID=7936 RepID=A0A0E9XIJ3_ANGAN
MCCISTQDEENSVDPNVCTVFST